MDVFGFPASDPVSRIEYVSDTKGDEAGIRVVSLNCRDEVLPAEYHTIRASQGTKVP
jgi:hypothetical protein